MPHQSDLFVLTVIVIALCFWLYKIFKRWLYAPVRVKLPFPEAAPFARSEAVRLLEDAGYEVLCGKMKVPLFVELDDELLEPGSRLFIDYFVRKDHDLYVVKLSRQRQPVEWTPSGIREALMNYHYLFKETHGILYVDLEEHRVRKIRIDIGEAE